MPFATVSTLTFGGLQLWRVLICIVALGPLAFYLIAIIATMRFFIRNRKKRLRRFTPPISVLKPVRGVDFASYENFKSFCLQDYPEYEILFCVNDLQDGAVPLIHRLMDEFPARGIRLLSGAAQLGANRKVSNLVLLAAEAKHALLVQSDGDVRVGPNYLREMAAPFERNGTAVVSCLYRGVAQDNLWAQAEALGVATEFSASVLVADWKEGVTFALGASVATTKSWLGRIGGYAALVNVLADDYEIGNRVAKIGGHVTISREIVWTMYPAVSFREFWEHQSRWARTIRLCRPFSYLGLLFTHGLPLALIGGVASGSFKGTAWFLGAYVLLRFIQAWTIGVWGMRDETAGKKWWLLPVRDAVHFAVWVTSFFSNLVVWGGMEFRLKANGEMVALGPANAKEREAGEFQAG